MLRQLELLCEQKAMLNLVFGLSASLLLLELSSVLCEHTQMSAARPVPILRCSVIPKPQKCGHCQSCDSALLPGPVPGAGKLV